MAIQAIETHYAGHRFRSRLEARWAVFFENAGIPWEYEPEGYSTPAGNYLPDFRLQLFSREVIFEVKPESERPYESLYWVRDGKDSHQRDTDLDERWQHAASVSDFYVTYGLPRMSMDPSWSSLDRIRNEYLNDFEAHGFSGDGHPPTDRCGEQNSLHRIRDNGEVESFEFFCRCPVCYAVEISNMGSMLDYSPERQRLEFTGCCDAPWTYPLPMYCAGDVTLLRSYDAARKARFEHGESG